ncbi:MAG: RNA-binding cell elongation regulator Jag/EloR, partial [Candidatus Hydrogenedentota bacterium]
MRSVEVSAKTREEAIDEGLRKLNAERHEVHVEVLDEGSSGFLGFGARPVRLRMSAEGEPLETEEEQPAGRAKKRGKSVRKEDQETSRRGRGGRRSARSKEDAAPEPASKDLEIEPPSVRPGGRAAKTGGSQASSASPEQPTAKETGNEAAALLETIIHYMGMEASVASQQHEDGNIHLNVDSPDSAILIGRKGQNLSALQYLLNRMIHHEDEEAPERIIIDVEGYLDRRRSQLEELARETAGKAKETGKSQRVKPMPPQERRILHLALQDDPSIKTYSVGSAQMRSVVVAPTNEDGNAGGSAKAKGDKDKSGENKQRSRRS